MHTHHHHSTRSPRVFTEAIMRARNLRLTLNGRGILEGVDLTLSRGEFLGLIGPNGGGKTSLLRLLLGVRAPTSGDIWWIPSADAVQPQLGYVPQRTTLDRDYPLSCREVVQQGETGRGLVWGARLLDCRRRANHWLDRFHLSSHADTPAADLSGGQQRRMLLARALMSRPEVLLLDEPTAGVDSEGQRDFCRLLGEQCARGMTVVLVSHDIPLVTEHADRIACLARTLHWHGEARFLSQDVIQSAYACELERYQTGHHHARHRAGPEAASPEWNGLSAKEPSEND